jgi:hypothetical protein
MSAILLNRHSHRRRSENPGDPHKAWDASAASITCPANTSLSAGSLTIGLRVSLIFLGRTESPLRVATLSRRDSLVSGFIPDLRRDKDRLNKAILVKFQGETESYKKFVKMNAHRLTTSAVSDRLIRAARQKGRREAGAGWADGIQHCLSWLP